MKKVVILQSNYIPWKGYFDLVNDADEFIFHDDLQYTKNDWRNRNKILTPRGSEWLTIPVGSSEKRLISEVRIADSSWQRKHWQKIRDSYAGAPYFVKYRDFFESFYLGTVWENLSVLNQFLVKHIATDFLGCETSFRESVEFGLTQKKQERVLELLEKTEATTYISGPAAKSYINAADFSRAGFDLVWKDYSGYPPYPQLQPSFEPGVTVLDLLFNVGSDAPWYIWGWRDSRSP